ncbi:uncharacterized protein LOC127877532 isoform X2 [Dreissena polymorpha]|uniref:uncharacterized protein LOC127877532 isoform X2 n=1 Tax=Dreissena polymorpha TaxID=45954 RepID=UPI002263BD53|nr:uncharacterized protein LOC127877532 isoform X2 [Dreissena polymorpha]
MNAKTFVISAVAFVLGCFVFVKMYYVHSPNDQFMNVVSLPLDNLASQLPLNDVSKMLIAQRNQLSKVLNLKQQKVGQLECEKKAGKGEATSETGGWCQQSSKEDSGNHMTDRQLVPALIELFQGKYVGSFGDGPGRYKQLLSDAGKLKGYDAYDGAPYCDVTSEGRVKFLDLTLPQFGLPLYDWIISLEVAEHIPAQFESIYIDNIVRHAKEGIVLSWARPGQGGYSHVNNRAFEYVVKLMDGLGFSHDAESSEKLRNAASLDWLRHNINVYRRKSPYLESLAAIYT